MAGNKLIFLNSLKLIFLIILNFGKIPQIGGTCSSLTSTSTISVRCLYNGTPLEHCEDPIDGTAVLILCLYQEYSLQQDIIPVCRNGQWSPSIPKCYTINSEAHSEVFGQSNLPSPQTRSNSICPSLTSSASTNFKCKHDVKPLENCENPLNETTVLISCNPSYEESSLQIDPIRLCINGKWSSTIPECKPSRYVAPTTTSERSYPLFGGQTTSTNHSNCESLASTESTNVRCYLNRKYLQNCQNPVHGTLVIIGCNSQYEESSLQYNSTRECRDGKWSSSIPQCTSIYGAAPFKSFKQFNPSLNNQASRHSVCPSLTSSTTINIKCILNGKLLNNCENVTNGTIAIISCNPFYTQPSLRNNPSRICKEGQWSASIPECYPIYSEVLSEAFENSQSIQSRYNSVCPSLFSSTSTNFTCMHNGKLLNNCENAVNGATVVISCNAFYETSRSENNPIRTCGDGKWSSSIPQCKPICGKPPVKNPLLGNQSSPHGYPWHVGIYDYAEQYLCGGTIINPNIILTAAHCVTDSDGNLNQLNNYLVAAGKYYRNYADIRDQYAQYSQISQVHIPRGYSVQRSYTFDIAVVILNQSFVLSPVVQPVCLDLYEKTANLDDLLNNPGVVTGWGSLNKGGPFSEVLKQLIIQYIPHQQCYQEVHQAQRSFITPDKICGSPIKNGLNICNGDGGGGLVFKNVVDDRYYIRGIASVGLFPSGDCYLSQYAVYTLVSRHIEFVKSSIQSYTI